MTLHTFTNKDDGVSAYKPEPFHGFKVGDSVKCNGYDGTVTALCEWSITPEDGGVEGMVEVRVPGGLVCVTSSELTRPVDPEVVPGYKRSELKDVFDKVAPAGNWKDPIFAVIPYDCFRVVALAVEFFTGSKLKVAGGPEALTGLIYVEAAGYYAAGC